MFEGAHWSHWIDWDPEEAPEGEQSLYVPIMPPGLLDVEVRYRNGEEGDRLTKMAKDPELRRGLAYWRWGCLPGEGASARDTDYDIVAYRYLSDRSPEQIRFRDRLIIFNRKVQMHKGGSS